MKICFITTGDIKNIATAKRALGLANPLSDLGWEVSILMEDTEENRHRVLMECDNRVNIYYFPHCSMLNERKWKNNKIKNISPDYLYICAFVTRNIVGIGYSRTKRLVEHSELQSSIPDMKGLRKIFCYMSEFYSIIYCDGLLNASKFLQKKHLKRASKLFCRKKPMLYYPYAFNPDIISVIDGNDVKEKFQKYLKQTTFVFLGTITRNYGVFTILEAVQKLLMQNVGKFKVLLLGSGRHYKEALDFVHENKLDDYVELPGFIDEEDISSYFSVASAFISPMNDTIQDWARCPSKLYLYLPFKKPIITCEIGEPYEILRSKGFYYATGNSDDLANQMNLVISQFGISIDVHAELHSWQQRAKELSIWIKKRM